MKAIDRARTGTRRASATGLVDRGRRAGGRYITATDAKGHDADHQGQDHVAAADPQDLAKEDGDRLVGIVPVVEAEKERTEPSEKANTMPITVSREANRWPRAPITAPAPRQNTSSP